jgi:pimeloyl-ACP methyl ester carboxylesterase
VNLTLSDGRMLAVHDTAPGTDAGVTVIWHHGSPQTGAALEPHLRAAAERGIRWVSYGRPEYGGSSPKLDRTIGNAAADVTELADALGLDRFAVMGASGGGPHALACAALLPDRVWAAATFASLAPFTTEFDWFAGMAGGGPSLRASQRGRGARREFELTAEFDDASFNTLDYAGLANEWASLTADVQRASSAGPAGLISDDLALVQPWRADLSAVTVPVLLVHGGDDRVVPVSHGHRLLELLPNSELWLRPRDGHISILDGSALAMDWLRERAFDTGDQPKRPLT